ncbi:MAG: hypothetical protein KAH34_17110, partial [Ketobacter sp.]|nr:hypothetical protein [Ketobacter sp.]
AQQHTQRFSEPGAAPAAIDPQTPTPNVLFPAMVAGALTHTLQRVETSLKNERADLDLLDYAGTGLKGIVSPLQAFQAPSAELLQSHAVRLSTLLPQLQKQIGATSKESGVGL